MMRHDIRAITLATCRAASPLPPQTARDGGARVDPDRKDGGELDARRRRGCTGGYGCNRLGLMAAGSAPVSKACEAAIRVFMPAARSPARQTIVQIAIWTDPGSPQACSFLANEAMQATIIRSITFRVHWSERGDLNSRPPVPQTGALTRLRYAPFLSVTHVGASLPHLTALYSMRGVCSSAVRTLDCAATRTVYDAGRCASTTIARSGEPLAVGRSKRPFPEPPPSTTATRRSVRTTRATASATLRNTATRMSKS